MKRPGSFSILLVTMLTSGIALPSPAQVLAPRDPSVRREHVRLMFATMQHNLRMQVTSQLEAHQLNGQQAAALISQLDQVSLMENGYRKKGDLTQAEAVNVANALGAIAAQLGTVTSQAMAPGSPQSGSFTYGNPYANPNQGTYPYNNPYTNPYTNNNNNNVMNRPPFNPINNFGRGGHR